MSDKERIIAPSILACDFARIAEECTDVVAKGADWLHCDVMDGHFVPNISFGAPVVASLRKAMAPSTFLDCHLMVSEPWKWVSDFAKAGASQFTFHVEVFQKKGGGEEEYDEEALFKLCRTIKEAGMRVGISVKPKTSVGSTIMKLCAEALGLVDMVLIMTVEPGFGGQKFMGDMMSKVSALRQAFPKLDIQVDGGVDAATAPTAIKAGANVFVAGTAVFKAPDRAAAIAAIRGPGANEEAAKL